MKALVVGAPASAHSDFAERLAFVLEVPCIRLRSTDDDAALRDAVDYCDTLHQHRHQMGWVIWLDWNNARARAVVQEDLVPLCDAVFFIGFPSSWTMACDVLLRHCPRWLAECLRVAVLGRFGLESSLGSGGDPFALHTDIANWVCTLDGQRHTLYVARSWQQQKQLLDQLQHEL